MKLTASVTPKELSELLLNVATARPVFVWGPPGIGKSSLVEKFASVQNASDNLRVFLGEPSQSPNLPQIKGYHLEEFIGAGGFGSVYK